MTGDDDSRSGEPAWHERTSTLAGASVAALIAIGILLLGASCVSREFNDPAPTPQYYLEPSTSGSATSSQRTSTEPITSTSPPVTTDINPGDTTSTTTTTTTTSSTDTTTSFDPSNLPRTRSSTPNDAGETSTRQRPRLNETRTLYPRP